MDGFGSTWARWCAYEFLFLIVTDTICLGNWRPGSLTGMVCICLVSSFNLVLGHLHNNGASLPDKLCVCLCT